MRKLKKISWGGILTIIGFILSPLSWWNDLVVNLPIAYGVAFLVSKINRSLFTISLLTAYWLTNILGLLMMHYGVLKIIKPEDKQPAKKKLIFNLLISVGYSLLVIGLIKLKILKLPG